MMLREISGRLQKEFNVDAERADRNVLELVTELCEQKLAESESA
jgi:hypothetical protein